VKDFLLAIFVAVHCGSFRLHDACDRTEYRLLHMICHHILCDQAEQRINLWLHKQLVSNLRFRLEVFC